jgi:Matrixin
MKLPSCFGSWAKLSIVLAILTISVRAQAWAGLEGPPFPHWGRIPVQYYVVKKSFPANIAEVAEARLMAGFSAWSAPECTFFDTLLMGDLPEGTFDINDGKNVLLWVNKPDAWPSELGPEDSVIGVTLPVWSNDGMGDLLIDDADIIFNNVGFCWFDFDPANPGTTCSGGKPVDTLSIVTHEQGHFLGLGHTNVKGATMEPAYLGGNALATIESDDIDGVCSLYPIAGSSGEGMTCHECRQHAAGLECKTPAISCSTDCFALGDCIQTCPRNDPPAYDICATQCVNQHYDGLDAYSAYSDCLCTICGKSCNGVCEGPSSSENENCSSNPSTKGDGVCKPPTYVGTGGCGCSLATSDEDLSLLATLGLTLVALSRRRRSR